MYFHCIAMGICVFFPSIYSHVYLICIYKHPSYYGFYTFSKYAKKKKKKFEQFFNFISQINFINFSISYSKSYFTQMKTFLKVLNIHLYSNKKKLKQERS